MFWQALNRRGAGPTNLFVDNTLYTALYTALWGRASIALLEKQHIMRRIAHRLRWQGGALQLHYVPSERSLADLISRWFNGQSAQHINLQAKAQEAVFAQCTCMHSAIGGDCRDRRAAIHHVRLIFLATGLLAALTPPTHPTTYLPVTWGQMVAKYPCFTPPTTNDLQFSPYHMHVVCSLLFMLVVLVPSLIHPAARHLCLAKYLVDVQCL